MNRGVEKNEEKGKKTNGGDQENVRGFRKKWRKEQRWEKMKKRRRERDKEGEKRAPGSQSQCKYASKHCGKKWDQIVNAVERWGSRRWLGNLTCIFKTHANPPAHLNKPQKHPERKREVKRKWIQKFCVRESKFKCAHAVCVCDEVVRVQAS